MQSGSPAERDARSAEEFSCQQELNTKILLMTYLWFREKTPELFADTAEAQRHHRGQEMGWKCLKIANTKKPKAFFVPSKGAC